MKVLLDENLDHALRRLLEPHEVVTPAVVAAIDKAAQGSFQAVDIGTFSRRTR